MKELRALEWKLLNPNEPLPTGLIIRRILDFLTGGYSSLKMKKGIQSMHTASQWFRYASHAILIRRNYSKAYYIRAINGTLNNSMPTLDEYIGFNRYGQYDYYNNFFAIIDTEILQRLNPDHIEGKVLQGILIFEEIQKERIEHIDDLFIARDILRQALNVGCRSQNLQSKGEDYLNKIENLIENFESKTI